MWEYEHSVETSATPDAVWRCWSDMVAWPRWNDGIEKIEIHGPFAVGTTFTMTPPGEGPVTLRLAEITPGRLFTDEMSADDFVVRTVHRLEHQVGPHLGPAITADFPEVLAALVKLAEGEVPGQSL